MKKSQFSYSKKSKKSKVSIDPDSWMKTAVQLFKQSKKQFSMLSRLQSLRSGRDPERTLCQTLIKKMDKNKVSMEDSYFLTQHLSSRIQSFRGELPSLLILLIGSGLAFAASIVFIILGRESLMSIEALKQDIPVIFWVVSGVVSLFLFGLSMRRRKAFMDRYVHHIILLQAASAYTTSKAPGKGGTLYEAFQQLDLLRVQLKQPSPFANLLGLFKKKKK